MSSAVRGGFPNRREVPSEWPGLLARATAITAVQSLVWPGPLEAVRDIHDAVGELSDERLEANRYYSLGEAMCNMARSMANPKMYARLVTDGADSFYRNAIAYDGVLPSLRVQRIGRLFFGEPLLGVSEQAVSDLPPAVRLLVETLRVAELARKRSDDKQYYMKTLQDQAIGRKFAAPSLALNSLLGAGLVLRRAILAESHRGPHDDVTIREIIDPVRIRDLAVRTSTRQVGTHCARLRLDEVRDLIDAEVSPIDEVLLTTKDGALVFDHNFLRRPPVPPLTRPNQSIPLHTARLGCPAIQVAMIPMTLGYLADVTIGADAQIADAYTRQRR